MAACALVQPEPALAWCRAAGGGEGGDDEPPQHRAGASALPPWRWAHFLWREQPPPLYFFAANGFFVDEDEDLQAFAMCPFF